MKKHIFITGPGRSGTTFLIRLLHAMGEETWVEPNTDFYSPEQFPDFENYPGQWEKEKRAGLEWPIAQDNLRQHLDHAPRIIKSPAYVSWMRYVPERIEHVIIPVRNLIHIAQSRVDVNLNGWVQEMPTEDIAAAWAIGRAVEAAVLADAPITIMHFPRLVEDMDYCWQKLWPIFSPGLRLWNFDSINPPSRFQDAWTSLSDPGMVHFRGADNLMEKFNE